MLKAMNVCVAAGGLMQIAGSVVTVLLAKSGIVVKFEIFGAFPLSCLIEIALVLRNVLGSQPLAPRCPVWKE